MAKECKDKGDTCTLSETGPNMTSVHGDACVPKECHEQAAAEKETARIGNTACRDGERTGGIFELNASCFRMGIVLLVPGCASPI